MSLMDPYRDDGVWQPWSFADGGVQGGCCATTLPGETRRIAREFAPGFHGANPGASLDDRGLPRVRVPARRGAGGRGAA